MNYFKTSLFIIFYALVFTGCSNELEDIAPERSKLNSKRVKFDSHDSFFNTWGKLSTMDKQELTDWIDRNNISLRNNGYENPNIDDDRDYFKALFDINNELQIQDSIIWYNDGKMLLVSSNGNENEVKINKLNFSECFVFGEIEKELVMLEQEREITTRGSIGSKNTSKKNEIEFRSIVNPGVRFIYVYQLASYKNTISNHTSYELVLTNKLLYKKSGSHWKSASETRICTTQIKGTVTSELYEFKESFPVNHNFTQELKNDCTLMLCRVAYPNGWHSFIRWNFNLSFNMTQEIKGDTGSRRNLSFTM